MGVAPSRVRGLKPFMRLFSLLFYRRTLTGAWIETLQRPAQCRKGTRRTLTGAWIETVLFGSKIVIILSHPHGCVD